MAAALFGVLQGHQHLGNSQTMGLQRLLIGVGEAYLPGGRRSLLFF